MPLTEPTTPETARLIEPTSAPTAVRTQPPTSAPTLGPTPVPTRPPTNEPTLAPTLRPIAPSPTPDPTRTAQQHYCDRASPPDRLPLPLLVPSIRIPAQLAPAVPTPAAGGPRQEGTEQAPTVTARNVAIVDEASGNLIYERDSHTRVAPASTTKILTTLVALERVRDLTSRFTTTVSASAMIACDGSSVMGLEPGDNVKLETLLYGMMLPSGNDAAEQVAVSLAGSRERYMQWMNEKVSSLGLRDTHFVTPSGMDADDHYSSAYDMAMLGRYAMQNATFRTIAGTPFIVSDDYYMYNLNPLIGTYSGADGVKIGFTDIAGRTIVASASRDGHRVYVALMGSRNLHGDSIALLEWVWRTFRW